jgi:hypothetical protein
VLGPRAPDDVPTVFKMLIIIGVIAAALVIGLKYQKSHPGGTNGVQVTTPVYRPPAPPEVLGTPK